ncbi:unnamed protein product [Notodromas monacha]|uniref:Uncharacterized protein n=1 Tax=Notodromas monacha TaxID=399045 RepID=A0A7R9GAL3_9CRUS|nr:unnamed protein product [Notodromas monacha]CAG0915549.1 unnamed protein product [Notodromas monacha]
MLDLRLSLLFLLPLAAMEPTGHTCNFMAYVMLCSFDYKGLDLRLTAIAHPCNDPVDVTFVIANSFPSFRWVHTFAVTNVEESIVVPPLSGEGNETAVSEVVRLLVQFAGDLKPMAKNVSSPGEKPVIFVNASFEAKSGREQFLDSLFVVRNEPNCLLSAPGKMEDSSGQVTTVALLSVILVAVVGALVGYIFYQRRLSAQQLAAALSSQATAKSFPYQQAEGGSRIVANGVMETSLIIENPVAPPPESVLLSNAETGAIPKSTRKNRAKPVDESGKSKFEGKQTNGKPLAEDKVPVVNAEENQQPA